MEWNFFKMVLEWITTNCFSMHVKMCAEREKEEKEMKVVMSIAIIYFVT